MRANRSVDEVMEASWLTGEPAITDTERVFSELIRLETHLGNGVDARLRADVICR